MAITLLKQGKAAEAFPFFEKQFLIVSKLGETSAQAEVIAFNNMGVALRETGRLDEAEAKLQVAIETARKRLRPRDNEGRTLLEIFHLANSLKNLAQKSS